MEKKKAYVLISGGLDSTLAVKMLQEQNIEVVGVYVSTGFCVSAQQKRNGRFDEAKPDVFKVSEELGIDMEVIDISQEYISIVANPKYGWGKNVNPCVDCRIHMLKKTHELMLEKGGDFIATGEVLGQRPMSQRRHTADIIENESGLKGLLLRPLSAQLFPTTIPEKEGWVERKKLGSIQGRSRKKQLALAKEYNLQNIQTPAGGCCYLTDENYAIRFKDMLINLKKLLFDPGKFALNHTDMIIMSIGRQVKIRSGLKMACGRNETENNLLYHYKAGKILMQMTEEDPGPSAILDLIPNEKNFDLSEEVKVWNSPTQPGKDLEDFLRTFEANLSATEALICGSIMARYSAGREKPAVKVILEKFDKSGNSVAKIDFMVSPLQNHEALNKKLLIKNNERNILMNIA